MTVSWLSKMLRIFTIFENIQWEQYVVDCIAAVYWVIGSCWLLSHRRKSEIQCVRCNRHRQDSESITCIFVPYKTNIFESLKKNHKCDLTTFYPWFYGLAKSLIGSAVIFATKVKRHHHCSSARNTFCGLVCLSDSLTQRLCGRICLPPHSDIKLVTFWRLARIRVVMYMKQIVFCEFICMVCFHSSSAFRSK